jgi:hypothetical protein
MLAAMHPELTMSSEAQELVSNFQRDYPAAWANAKSGNRGVEDAWDAKMRFMEDPTALQKEMDSLCAEFASQGEVSLSVGGGKT